MSQSSRHQADHSHENKGFRGFWQTFKVFSQATLTVQSGKSALNHPSLWQNLEANLAFQFCHNLQGPAKRRFDPFHQTTSVASICPEELQTAPIADALHQSNQEQLGSIAVLHICGGYNHQQNQAQRIDQQVAFASSHLFPGIKAAFRTAFSRFYRLAIQNGGTGFRRSAFFLPHRGSQGAIHLLPGSVNPPNTKVMIDSFPRRQIFRQHAPGPTTAQSIKDRIQNFAPSVLAGTTRARRFWHVLLNRVPFVIIQVCRVSFSGFGHPQSLPDFPFFV
jgi:hypothetical protein